MDLDDKYDLSFSCSRYELINFITSSIAIINNYITLEISHLNSNMLMHINEKPNLTEQLNLLFQG